MRNSIFVDLPNFYNQLCRLKLEGSTTKEYFVGWFLFNIFAGFLAEADFIKLTQEVQNEITGVWIFHSNNPLGPSGVDRIDGKDREAYIRNVYRLYSVTTVEPKIKSIKKEKGVDSLLITSLFDTLDYWDCAYLVSGDGDYCPAVEALRRRGKKVIVAGIRAFCKDELIRDAHSFIDVKHSYIIPDHELFKFFIKDHQSIISSLKSLLPDTSSISIAISYNNIFIHLKENKQHNQFLQTSEEPKYMKPVLSFLQKCFTHIHVSYRLRENKFELNIEPFQYFTLLHHKDSLDENIKI